MLSETCLALKNWFDDDGYGGKRRLFREFKIKDGTLEVPEAKEGQYIRICESTFNDGVYKYPATGLTDETFNGAVWLMEVPPDVIAADKDFDDWKKTHVEELTGPYQSESFGGYSYSKAITASGAAAGNGILSSPFASRVAAWRKI